MKIILLSSTKFGASCLKELLKLKQTISAIITTERKIDISYADNGVEIFDYYDFKDMGRNNEIPLLISRGKNSELKGFIEKIKPDIIIAAGWYYMVPESIRKIPKYGCFGFHASLLPKYAGGAPVNWAIINGEKETGITFFFLEDGVDTGDIIDQKRTHITHEDTCKTVYERLTRLACEIIQDNIPLFELERVKPRKQNLSKRSINPQRKPDDGLVNWDKRALEIYNLIRAITKPYPGAFTFYNGKKLKIWEGRMYGFISEDNEPGKVLEILSNKHTKGILVSTEDRDTQLLLTRIAFNGGEDESPIKCAEKLRIKPGDRFGR